MRLIFTAVVTALIAGLSVPAPQRAQAVGRAERLAVRARRGDRSARAALVEEHMGLVRSIAFRYRNLGLPVEDLVQEGAIGLLSAIDEFDPARAASFSTYAYWRVRAAVTHALTARASLIRVPRTVLEHRRAIAGARRRLAASGATASPAVLAEETALPVAGVLEALAPVTIGPLEAVPGAGEASLDGGDQPDAIAVALEERLALRRALVHLPPRKRAIVSRHFGIDVEPETLAQIASDLRVSPERARVLKDEALRELAAELDAA